MYSKAFMNYSYLSLVSAFSHLCLKRSQNYNSVRFLYHLLTFVHVQYVDMDFKALFFEKLYCELIWISVFHQALDTAAQSLVFVKRMVVIAVSSITYLRGIFPEDSYRSRYLEGINIHTGLLMAEQLFEISHTISLFIDECCSSDLCIKVLKQDCSCPGARKLIKW